jgi:hypothetical protein
MSYLRVGVSGGGMIYLVMKNEVLSLTSKWVELENIILREVRQAQKTKNHMFSLTCRL